MTFQYDTSGTGPSQFVIATRVNRDDFATIFSDAAVYPSDETHIVDLTAFDDGEHSTFQLLGFDAFATVGRLDIEKIIDGDHRGILVTGEHNAAPEPD